jgi:hypothetical protein
MQTWEYCHLKIMVLTLSEQQIQTMEKQIGRSLDRTNPANPPMGGELYFFGEKLTSEVVGNMGETIARLGAEGWEMTGYSLAILPPEPDKLNPPTHSFFFKRPIDSESRPLFGGALTKPPTTK